MIGMLLAEAGWSEGWRLGLEALIALITVFLIPWAKSVRDNLKSAATEAARAATQSELLGKTLSAAMHDNRAEHKEFYDKINAHDRDLASLNERVPSKRRGPRS